MRLVFLLVLIMGFGLAGYAAYMVMQQFQGYQTAIVSQRATYEAEIERLKGEIVPPVEMSTIIVAKNELRFGTALIRDDVEVLPWPAANVPPRAFTSLEELFGAENSAARYITRVMEPGEPILTSKVTNIGEDAGVRSRLDEGMRAFTINVDVTTGVSGFLQPGDSVDMYWSGADTTGATITRLILEDVPLIAIDQNADVDLNRPSVARTVTLQVSPEVVAKMVQAQQTGRITLSLRGIEDTTTSGALQVNQGDVIGFQEQPEAVETICTVRRRVGTEVVETVIPCR